MQIEDFLALINDPQGPWALESATAFEPRQKDFGGDFKMLAKRFGRELAFSSLTTAILRSEAEGKFPHAEKMYFLREGMEQAAPWKISTHIASRFKGASHVLNIGCSIGISTLALAEHAPVAGIDPDPLNILIAKENAKVLNAEVEFIESDLNTLPPDLPPDTAIFIDPTTEPTPQTLLDHWLHQNPNLAIRLPAETDLAEFSSYDCETETITLNGEQSETVLWFGDFKNGEQTQYDISSD